MLITLLKPLPGILVQLAISWLLVWLIEKRNLGVLGFSPTNKRIIDSILFFFITAFCCSTGFIMRMILAHEQWELNPTLSGTLILNGAWWNLTSVLYEELIFRGVILYILIRRIGVWKGIILSSIAFGIYHWFSFNQLGNYLQMTITFFTTGIFGLLLAYAYQRTSSLYVPIAIHFGWNFTHGFLFSQGPIGNGIFIPVSSQPQVTISYFTFYCIMILHILAVILLNYFLLKKQPASLQVLKKELPVLSPPKQL